MLSPETYRARFGPAAVSVLALAAAAGVLLVLLPEQWQRIVVASVAWAAGVAIAVLLVRRATAREKARVAELETAEARHRALLDGLPLVTWLTAPGSRAETLYVGPGIADLTGYSPTEWSEQPDLHERLLHPDDRERVLHELEHAGDAPTSIDYRFLARDGRAVWVREDSAIVRDQHGEPLYVQTFLRDIGDLKRGDDRRELLEAAEREAAAESAARRARLDLLRRVGSDIAASAELDGALGRVAELVVVDLADWCVIDVVDESNELRRVAAARGALIKPNGARGLGDDPEREVRAVFESGRTRVLPKLDERSSGGRVSFLGDLDARSVISVPLQARKQHLGVLTLARTEQGAAYSADDVALAEDLASRLALALDRARLYREVEERSDAAWVLEHVADGVLLLDRNGVVRLWNPAAEAITFIAAGDVVGRPASDAIPGWKAAVETVPVSASPDPGHDEVLIPIETSRGERWIAISGVRFFGGTVYAFRDLTDTRRLEEIKADFIATASHELRTPLAAVYGAAQTLLRHDFALDETGRERFVSLIADESERLGRIVNEILLANQLDAGRLDLESEPFDPHDLVERVVEATRMHAPPSVSLEVDAPEGLSAVAADADKVRQVVVNLVENAIKYSPDGGRVEVGVEEGDGAIRFHVRDEGLGVAPEDQERIFEKFYRADPQMVRGVGGTGLGLYICKELIDRMGGRIWVEPNGDRGSNFVFELPTAEVMAHGEPVPPRLQFRN
ncbi:MAG TPA: ATP-binding protein [Gaiellaceae bacterium]|nr:ATP-binding protein [Gaiellaceae bacterium]